MSTRHVVRRLSLLVVLALVAAGALVGWRHLSPRDGIRLSADFSETVGLYPGSDVQILGVPVGHVTAVRPHGDVVRVSMELTPGQQVDAQTGAVIVAPTLVSDRYVQLTTPYVGGTPLASGTHLPRDRTAVPVEIDQLYASLDDVGRKLGPKGINKHGALSRFLNVAAANLDGQGTQLNQMIAEFGKATGTLSDTDEDFFATLAHLERFNDMLVANDRGVAHVNRQFGAVTHYLAADRADLRQAVDNLGGALSILDDFIRSNRGHLRTSVENLRGPTAVLVRQRRSLEEAVRTAPLALQNFLRAYNPTTNTVDGRGNLNELTLWSRDGLSARTSGSAPPVLIPEDGGSR